MKLCNIKSISYLCGTKGENKKVNPVVVWVRLWGRREEKGLSERQFD